jgi:hypothetical protein
VDDPTPHGGRGRSFPLHATLDIDGTPQSGTGQAALLTGANAAEIHGGHFGPWTPVGLRPLVENQSVLRRAVDAGRSVAFANAYPKGWPGAGNGRRIAGPPLAARGAGVLTRHEEELGRGDAVSSEIVNDGWRRYLGHDLLPDLPPEDAGRNLGAIANTNELTLFAHYATDTAGHRGGMAGAVQALELVDQFLSGLIEGLAPDVLLLLASDHGNIEDARVGHTRNPALGAAWGPPANGLDGLRDLRQVTPFILTQLGVSAHEA